MDRSRAIALRAHEVPAVRLVAVALALSAVLMTGGCENDREVRVADPAAPAAPAGEAQTAGAREKGGDGPDAVILTSAAVQPVREGNLVKYALAYPTGERESSAVLLEKSSPAEVRVGQPYNYTITVTNLTDAPLSGVTVFESLGAGVAFESASPPPQRALPTGEQQQQQPGQQQQQATTQAAAAQQGQQQQQQAAARQPASTQPASTQQAGGQQTPLRWFLGELPPRGSYTIQASAIAERPGQAGTCLAVAYAPTLCTAVKVVQPQLTVAKAQAGLVDLGTEGRQIAYLCDTLKYTYTVTNSGSGVARNVTIQDDLPEGLQTADGKQQVSIPAGDIPAGQSKDFAVDIRPTRTGDFSSRALARSQTDEASSNQVVTPVREPELAVEVNAPEWQYVDQPVTYTVRVRNTGDVPARNVVLNLQAPGVEADDARRELGDIAAGQSRTASVTLRPAAGGDVKLVAVANSVCLTGQDISGTAVTAVRTVPALVLEMVDNTDPVEVGGTTVYSIAVKNQGSGPAKNVALTATLPQGFEFVEGAGQTKVQRNGSELSFGKIDQLAPGEVATWWVEAKATQAADARFEVRLNSDYLDKPVPEVEPTRAIEPRQAAAQQRAGQ